MSRWLRDGALCPAWVIDLDPETSVTAQELSIRNGAITARRATAARPEVWATAGLVDTHVHWLMFAGTSMPQLVETLVARPAEAEARAVENARAALRAGITTACDKGAPTPGVGHYHRRLTALRADDRSIPRTVYAPFMAVDRASFAGAWCRQVEHPAQALGLGDAAREEGGEVLKIIPEGDWSPAPVRYPTTLPRPLFDAAVRAGRAAGMLVAVHGKARASIEAALEARVDAIEHGLEATASHLAAMRERGVSLGLTLHGFARRLAWATRHGQRLEVACEEWEQATRVARLVAADPSLDMLVTGSDAGSFDTPHGTLDELYHLRRCGLAADRVLRAATLHGARALGKAGRVGALREGAWADIVLWDCDPLALPLDAWDGLARHIVAVITDGEVAWQRSTP